MKKLNYLLFAILAILVFQTCKTKQKVQNNSIGKKTVFQDTMPNMTYLLNDTTMLCFDDGGVVNIKEHLPTENISCLNLNNDWECKGISEVYALTSSCLGYKNANEYLPIFEKYSKKSTKEKVIKAKSDSLLRAVDSDQLLGDPGFPYSLNSISNIPYSIKELYKNYPLFYIVQHRTKNLIGTIYNGEVVMAERLINIAYKSVKQEKQFSIKERFKILLLLIHGFDTKVTINAFSEFPEKGYTHEANVSINENIKTYKLNYQFDGISNIVEFTNDNKVVLSKSFNY